MDVLAFEDPGHPGDSTSFAARVRPILLADRLGTNIIATVLENALAGSRHGTTRWFLIEDGEDVVAAAMHTVGINLMVSPLPEAIRDQAAAALADVLVARGEGLAAAAGRHVDLEAFTQAWVARGGASSRLILNEWVYEIRQAPAIPDVPGSGRLSVADDGPELVAQLSAFNREAFPNHTVKGAENEVARRLERRALMVWEHEGTLVSLAGLNGPAAGVGRIGPVYTPPQFRRQGFGGAVTAYAVRTGFQRGAELCMLYADQDNPTSNRVYSRLGFRCVDSNVMLAFDPDS